MLNRKASNYIFYLILIGIVAIVYLVRSVMLGGMIDRTNELDSNNIILQAQIDYLEDIVQTNKNIQESHLYELYNEVPQTYSKTELTYIAISKLELVGIDESLEFYRSITINPDVTITGDSMLAEVSKLFNVVEVQVEFSTTDLSSVADLIDLLSSSEQVFVVNYVDFHTPTDVDDYVNVEIHFLAFYEK